MGAIPTISLIITRTAISSPSSSGSLAFRASLCGVSCGTSGDLRCMRGFKKQDYAP